jgi:hypothetical protein
MDFCTPFFAAFCDWRCHRPKWKLLSLATEGAESLSREALRLELLLIKRLPMEMSRLETRPC